MLVVEHSHHKDFEHAKIHNKLKLHKQHLKNWIIHTFGNIFTNKALLEQDMAHLQQQIIFLGRTEETNAEEHQLTIQIGERTKREDIY